ncbi:hypothetical protein RchiOBHm_Chr1g0329451 [Rosa chinensis]|uniref:Uncharacterized protein n=1 Tax=Rosa chinensis TaxID=74649 RepID=A0A2P6SB27_ROSCH|nr:hypothetical protein RchiOBHm_Chr1g0329451 [Rosa chinensis]
MGSPSVGWRLTLGFIILNLLLHKSLKITLMICVQLPEIGMSQLFVKSVSFVFWVFLDPHVTKKKKSLVLLVRQISDPTKLLYIFASIFSPPSPFYNFSLKAMGLETNLHNLPCDTS